MQLRRLQHTSDVVHVCGVSSSRAIRIDYARLFNPKTQECVHYVSGVCSPCARMLACHTNDVDATWITWIQQMKMKTILRKPTHIAKLGDVL